MRKLIYLSLLTLLIICGLCVFDVQSRVRIIGGGFIGPAGMSVVASGTLSDPRPGWIDGSAFIWDSGVTLTAYAGTDGSDTPYQITLTDASGDTAVAWLGSAGAGETLGGELVTDGVFEAVTEGADVAPNETCTAKKARTEQDDTDGWTNDGFDTFESTTETTEPDGDYSLHVVAGDHEDRCLLTLTTSIGKTYKVVIHYKKNAATDDGGWRIWDNSWLTSNLTLDSTSWTSETGYFTAITTSPDIYISENGGTNNSEIWIDYVEVFPVTFTSWTDTADGLAPQTAAGSLTSKAAWDGSQSSSSFCTQSGTLVARTLYKSIFTVSDFSAGLVRFKLGNALGTLRSSDDTYTEYIVAGAATHMQVEGGNTFVGAADDVSVKAVTDPPATGLHGVSTKNGGTRNWTFDATFGKNESSYTYEIKG